MALATWFLAVVGVVLVVPRPALAEDGDPVGAFDILSVGFGFPFAPQEAPWFIRGWAADPDAPGQPVDVHIYIDGGQPDQNFNSNRGAWAEPVIVTGDPRPDVAAVYPFAGEKSGWSTAVEVFDGQPHTVCAYAINQGAGTQNTTLGCVQIPTAGTTNLGDPQGFLDGVDIAPGAVRFHGWAGDPDPDAVPTTPVRVFQDGRPLLQITPSVDRPDVHAVFPGYANAAGFDATAPAFPGVHIYCVDAGNSGSFGTNNTSLGCVLRDVPSPSAPASGDLHGALDAVVTHFDSQADNPAGQYVEGWAWDPTTPPPYQVTVRGIERRFDKFGAVFSTDGTTTEPRPDVQGVYPAAPANTGYKINFPNSFRPSAPTPMYFCAYARRGPTEQFLGCISNVPL